MSTELSFYVGCQNLEMMVYQKTHPPHVNLGELMGFLWLPTGVYLWWLVLTVSLTEQHHLGDKPSDCCIFRESSWLRWLMWEDPSCLWADCSRQGIPHYIKWRECTSTGRHPLLSAPFCFLVVEMMGAAASSSCSPDFPTMIRLCLELTWAKINALSRKLFWSEQAN